MAPAILMNHIAQDAHIKLPAENAFQIKRSLAEKKTNSKANFLKHTVFIKGN